jgi:hypothetical protein
LIGAELDRPHGGLDLLDGGDHHYLDRRIVFLEDLQDFEAVDAGEADVEEQEVHVLLVHHGEGRLAGAGLEDAEIAAQDGRERIAHPLVVIDDQHRLALRVHGRPREGIIEYL